MEPGINILQLNHDSISNDDVSFQESINNNNCHIVIAKQTTNLKFKNTWAKIHENEHTAIFYKAENRDVIKDSGKAGDGIIFIKVQHVYIYSCHISKNKDKWLYELKRSIEIHMQDSKMIILTGCELKDVKDINTKFWNSNSLFLATYDVLSKVKVIGTSQIVIKPIIGFWDTNNIYAKDMVEHMNHNNNNNFENCEDNCTDFTIRLIRAAYNCIPDNPPHLETDWEKLCKDVESNPFLLTKFLKRNSNNPPPNPESFVYGGVEAVIKAVFNTQIKSFDLNKELSEVVPEVTEEEMFKASKRLRKARSSGPDGIPYKILKKCVFEDPHDYLKILNRCFQQGKFPHILKQAKLVLIFKDGKKESDPKAYRPVCLLNSTAKLAERILFNRIDNILEEKKLLSENQFAFSKGKTREDALIKIREIADSAFEMQQCCIAITLDVRNAFNAIPPESIIDSLVENNFPNYIIQLIRSYLTDRTLIYKHNGEEKEIPVCIAAPQGSVLGPLFWKIGYDGILKLKFPEGVQILTYCDDVIFTVTDKSFDQLQSKASIVMDEIVNFFTRTRLEFANEKIGAIWLNSTQENVNIKALNIGNESIKIKGIINFLGIYINSDPFYTPHVKERLQETNYFLMELEKLMDNHVEEIPEKYARRLMSSGIREYLLYASPAWAKSLENKNNEKLLKEAFRKVALRNTFHIDPTEAPELLDSIKSYVPTQVAEVLAGIIPADLEIRERKIVWDYKKNGKGRNWAKKIARTEVLKLWQKRWKMQSEAEWTPNGKRAEALKLFQERWEMQSGAEWAKKIIPNVEKWFNCKHRFVDLYTAQFLSGYGMFQGYFYAIDKANSPECLSCGFQVDDAEHTFIACPRFAEEREKLARVFKDSHLFANPLNFGKRMLESEESWKKIANFSTEILRKKQCIFREYVQKIKKSNSIKP